MVAESDNITLLNTSGADCEFQKNLNHLSYNLNQIQNHLLNQGVPSNIVDNVNPNYFYKVSLNGGGGVNTRTEMALCLYDVIPEICIVKGISDASDVIRASINTTDNFSESFGFNGQGWVDATGAAQASTLYLAMDSESGLNADTRIDMYLGTDEIIETLGVKFLDENSDDFGGGSVVAVDVMSSSNISGESLNSPIIAEAIIEDAGFLRTADNSSHELNLIPNPAKNVIFVSCESCPKVRALRIYDLYGKLNYSNHLPNLPLEFDLSNFTPGIYLMELVLQDQGEVVRKKFIKIK